MAELESMLALMHDNWKVFRKHRPRGEYLPVGDIDGDCAECGSEWPCSAVREVLTSGITDDRS